MNLNLLPEIKNALTSISKQYKNNKRSEKEIDIQYILQYECRTMKGSEEVRRYTQMQQCLITEVE